MFLCMFYEIYLVFDIEFGVFKWHAKAKCNLASIEDQPFPVYRQEIKFLVGNFNFDI